MKFKIISLVVLILAIVGGIGLTFFSLSRNDSRVESDNSMLELTLEWGRLSQLPSSVTNFQIQTEGSSFTRSFRSSFLLPLEDLDDWVNESAGLNDTTTIVETLASGKKKYVIKPGSGANYAEVVIDFTSGFVEVYVSWS